MMGSVSWPLQILESPGVDGPLGIHVGDFLDYINWSGSPILTVGGTNAWAWDLGLHKTETVNWACLCPSLPLHCGCDMNSCFKHLLPWLPHDGCTTRMGKTKPFLSYAAVVRAFYHKRQRIWDAFCPFCICHLLLSMIFLRFTHIVKNVLLCFSWFVFWDRVSLYVKLAITHYVVQADF